MMKKDHDYGWTLSELNIEGKKFAYYDLKKLNDQRIDSLPYSIRVLLESVIRNCDGIQIHKNDVENIMNWSTTQHGNVEFPFRPARAVLQDLSAVPAVVDFASIRDAVARLGGDPLKVNPITPADLIIDYPVQVEYFQSSESLKKNQEVEFERNKELFQFLKWGSKAFKNVRIIPPGSGFVHQVNLEYLAKMVFNENELLYPDSLVGADSHTMMINGLGILGWGVGGIEAESVMLGQAVAMVIPKVIGYKISGVLNQYATSTDVVIAVTKHLRQVGVAGKFVEFFGPGVASLSIADRATIANMCPEYGATVGFFPADNVSLLYLQQSGHSKEKLKYIESYLKANNLFRSYKDEEQNPHFTEVLELDLANIVPTFSGPKRPNDRVGVHDLKNDFKRCLNEKIGFKGFAVPINKQNTSASFIYEGTEFTIKHGSIVMSSITSCTNTSCPSVMLGAGLLAKNAVEAGLSFKPYIKASINPGSAVVSCYLQESGVEKYLKDLGFDINAYGSNEKLEPLPKEVSQAIKAGDLVTCGLLSGNRNFEARVHPLIRANYLGSPLLVIAHTLAGTIDIDLEKEPIGYNKSGEPVFLSQIWPKREEIQEAELKYVIPALFRQVCSSVSNGNTAWNNLKIADSLFYPWDSSSTYIRNVPFFDHISLDLPSIKSIENAIVLLKLGDSITTDHISPAGMIARNCPAAKYLANHGLSPKQFNSYGSRRGNVEVMARGTFANIRIFNKIIGKVGPKTKYWPSGEEMDIYEAVERYKRENKSLIILAGKEYGSGSSRDWAAKGPWIQGIKAIIAESYEPTHKSNLIGMGIAPLEHLEGQTAETLGLTGKEVYNIEIPKELTPNQFFNVKLDNGRTFQVKSRFDTELDILYYRHGGILSYIVRRLCND